MSPDDTRTWADGQTETRPYRVLFVCLGNICRSPSAEIVFNAVLEREGMAGKVEVDSCGTASYHTGQKPDRRMRAALEQAGYTYGGHLARSFRRADFREFDLIVPQDHDNEYDLLSYARSDEDRAKIHGMWEWFPASEKFRDVPDPYYGGADGFREVVSLLERACSRLAGHLRSTLHI